MVVLAPHPDEEVADNFEMLEMVEDNFELINRGEVNGDILEEAVESLPIAQGEAMEPGIENQPLDDLKKCTIDYLTPYEGRFFSTYDEAYNYYNAFAFKRGFGTRKASTGYSRKVREVNRKVYSCHRGGIRKIKKRDGPQKRSRSVTRIGCKAMMSVVSTDSGRWKVSQFLDEHCHEMLSPSKVVNLYSHNFFHRSEMCKKVVNMFWDQGIRPSVMKRLLSISIPSSSQRVTTQQVCDLTRDMSNQNIGGECTEIVLEFYRRKAKDDQFYFNYALDDDGTLKHIFWADSRARKDYRKFRDIVVFDVTYRTNKFSLPFAPFTGVNHHKQSILFGCAFLRNEQTESFIWLFNEFIQCMDYSPPIAILTDQDHAICSAVNQVFTTTIHRYCSWHIGGHLKTHLGHLFNNKMTTFKKDYDSWFYSRHMDEAESEFDRLNAKYDLMGNRWFSRLYEKRDHWVPCYLKGPFWAGMTTTQRSESMNAFFDGFVNTRTQLSSFVKKYDCALKSRREEENVSDYKTLSSMPILILDHDFEKEAASFYTRDLFYIFQKEFKQSQNLKSELVEQMDTLFVYNVSLRGKEERRPWQVRFDDTIANPVLCECFFFTSMGIPCSHMLHILVYKQMIQIPYSYFLKRWSIQSRVLETEIGPSTGGNCNNVFPLLVSQKLDVVLAAAVHNAEVRDKLDSFLSELQSEINAEDGCEIGDQAKMNEDGVLSSATDKNVFIKDPVGLAINKGRPKTMTRIKSTREQKIQQSAQQKKQPVQQQIDPNEPKKRLCSYCRCSGHNCSTCPEKK